LPTERISRCNASWYKFTNNFGPSVLRVFDNVPLSGY
jgi:hypothetical protein